MSLILNIVYGKYRLDILITLLIAVENIIINRNKCRLPVIGVFTGVVNGVTYYLLDNEYYFQRNGLYGFYDDAERFIFFSRAVLELLRYIDFKPNVINANDWQPS